jgi:hypothetical protein
MVSSRCLKKEIVAGMAPVCCDVHLAILFMQSNRRQHLMYR